MALNTFPIYPGKPNNYAYGLGSVATDYAGAAASLVFSPGSQGAFLAGIPIVSLGTNPATKALLFYSTDGGTSRICFGEAPLEATVASSTDRNSRVIDLLAAAGLGGGFAVGATHAVYVGFTVVCSYGGLMLGGDY